MASVSSQVDRVLYDVVAEELQIKDGARLREDLHLDELGMLELVERLERIPGCPVPLDVNSLIRVADVRALPWRPVSVPTLPSLFEEDGGGGGGGYIIGDVSASAPLPNLGGASFEPLSWASLSRTPTDGLAGSSSSLGSHPVSAPLPSMWGGGAEDTDGGYVIGSAGSSSLEALPDVKASSKSPAIRIAGAGRKPHQHQQQPQQQRGRTQHPLLAGRTAASAPAAAVKPAQFNVVSIEYGFCVS